MNRKNRRSQDKKTQKTTPAHDPAAEAARQAIIQKAFATATELQKIGKAKEAENLYHEIINNDLTHGGAWHHLGLIISDNGDTEKAAECIEKALEYYPNYHQAWNSLGSLRRKQHRHKDALDCFDACLKIQPDYADAITNKGNIYWDLRDYKQAEELYRQSLACDKKEHLTYITYCSLGHTLRDQGRIDEAHESYQKSQKLNPDNTEIYIALGNMHQQQGKFDDAQQEWRRALVLDREQIDAHYSIAHAKTFKDPNDPDLKALLELNDSAKQSPHTREWLGKLNFSLGKAFHDLKDYDLAFEKFKYANTLIRGTFDYDKNSVRKNFTTTKQVFTSQFMKQHQNQGLSSKKPIFILGMPRSGTTLVEQILASHPDVHGAGELKDFALALSQAQNLATYETDQMISKKTKDLIDADFLQTIGDRYLDTINKIAPDSPHVTDKMPTNFAWVGMIKLVFPNAKIIHCQRNPMDTCLSCYTRLFTELTAWSHDLEELGDFYRQYQALMAHWHHIMPEQIFDFQYEDLITNQEERTRALLEYCELDWDDKCLTFHKTERAISTASDMQVRKPLYKEAVERWKKYESHLSELRHAIGKKD